MFDLKNIKINEKFDSYYQENHTVSVNFENNKLKDINESFTSGVGIRVIKDNKVGFASTSDLTSINEMVNLAIENSKFGEKAYFNISNQKFQQKNLNLLSRDIENLDIEYMVEMGNDILNNTIKKINNNTFINIEIEKSIYQKSYFNSNNLYFEDKKSLFECGISIFQAEENNFIEIGDMRIDTLLISKNELDSMIEKILLYYDFSKRVVDFTTGYYPVYFTPKAFRYLISFLIESLNGKLIEKKISFFTDKIGEKFSEKNISIIDNPLMESKSGSFSFDGDGINPEKIYLIKDGIVNDYILDLQTGGKLNKKSNGHAGRSYNSLPSPIFSNIIFEFNKKSREDDIICSIDKGIIVDALLGAGQSNILGGEFSANIESGYVVEKGKIKGRLKNSMISGNLFEIFNKLVAITEDSINYRNIFSPGALFDNLSIAV